MYLCLSVSLCVYVCGCVCVHWLTAVCGFNHSDPFETQVFFSFFFEGFSHLLKCFFSLLKVYKGSLMNMEFLQFRLANTQCHNESQCFSSFISCMHNLYVPWTWTVFVSFISWNRVPDGISTILLSCTRWVDNYCSQGQVISIKL